MSSKSKSKSKSKGKGGEANASGGAPAPASSTILSRQDAQIKAEAIKANPDELKQVWPGYFHSLLRGAKKMTQYLNGVRQVAKMNASRKLLLPKLCAYKIHLDGEAWGDLKFSQNAAGTAYYLEFLLNSQESNDSLHADSERGIWQYDFRFYEVEGGQTKDANLHDLVENVVQFLSCFYCRKVSTTGGWEDLRTSAHWEKLFYPSKANGIESDVTTAGVTTGPAFYIHPRKGGGVMETRLKTMVESFKSFNTFFELYSTNLDTSPSSTDLKHVTRDESLRSKYYQRVRDNLYVMHVLTRMFRPFSGYDDKSFEREGNYIHARQAMTNAVETLIYLTIPDKYKFLVGLDTQDPDEYPALGGAAAQMMGLFIDKTLCFTQEMSEA